MIMNHSPFGNTISCQNKRDKEKRLNEKVIWIFSASISKSYISTKKNINNFNVIRLR